jgi:Zn-dependent M28 family amino/carboxypeptidase
LVKSKKYSSPNKRDIKFQSFAIVPHYDSAPHPFSRGASDAGSGVATILESVRAFLFTTRRIKNDIIILFGCRN